MLAVSASRVSIFVICFAGLVALTMGGAAQAQGQQEEFVGPFASWRQVRCGGNDDTALLQNELNTLGRSGSPVLYIQAGTCRITSTLHLGEGAGGASGVIHVTILGHDPADTKIVWGGPAGRDQRMFQVTGVAQSRFGRLTWDGGGGADVVYYDDWPNTHDFFPTGNRHEDEVFQNLWRGGGIAFYVGALGYGGSEWEYMRCKFLGPMEAGIFLGNFNALDHWVWDSLFQNVQYGVTNYLPDRPVGAGGAWGVNRSVFLNSDEDMAIANTEFFSSRWNYSRGSGVHVHSHPIGNAPSPWTSQGETIIDPAWQNAPFVFGSTGALGLIDATIRNGPSGTVGAVFEGYSDSPGGDLWGLGNTFSNPNADVYSVGGGSGRMHVGVDDKRGQQIADPGPPQLPPTPAPANLPVIDVQNGDIAGALMAAGDRPVTVHVPYGAYTVDRTLEVGPNVILTGDGFGATQLNGRVDPVLHLKGPSHAVVRDLGISSFNAGQRVGSGILIDGADQPGGLIHVENWISGGNDTGFDIAGLRQTVVQSFDSMAGSNSRAERGLPGLGVDYKVSEARLHIFNGDGADSDAIYELHGGELIAETMFYQGGVHNGIPDRLIAPNSSGTMVLDIGNFASSGGIIDASTFNGLLTINGFGEGPNTQPGHQPARAFGANTLLMGFDFGWANDSAPPTFSAQPYLFWLPRRNNGGGSDMAPESSAGVADAADFLRSHFAPLRRTKPLTLDRRATGVTDVRLYRVGASPARAGLEIRGGQRS